MRLVNGIGMIKLPQNITTVNMPSTRLMMECLLMGEEGGISFVSMINDNTSY